ncbi:hypothetical protein AERO9AM_11045 [Aeromicrobium sp. 9AM]|nr:hypothetical protein AERO9AM_11045 [Aeromicrobium sp. 9AM]
MSCFSSGLLPGSQVRAWGWENLSRISAPVQKPWPGCDGCPARTRPTCRTQTTCGQCHAIQLPAAPVASERGPYSVGLGAAVLTITGYDSHTAGATFGDLRPNIAAGDLMPAQSTRQRSLSEGVRTPDQRRATQLIETASPTP